MIPIDEGAPITSERQIKDVADRCVSAFWSEVARQPGIPHTLSPIDSSDSPPQGYGGKQLLSVHPETRSLTFRYRTKNILGQPEVVFKAALELEMALLLLRQVPKRFNFNYQRRITPLVHVTGAAVHIIRNIVWEIENALQRHAATQYLIERRHARHQLLFYYHQLQPSEKEKADYKKRRPHDWVHALYLAQKSCLFLPLSLLQKSGLSPGLASYWWDCHEYFSRSDRGLLEQLAAVLTHQAAESPLAYGHRYEDQVVALFNVLPT